MSPRRNHPSRPSGPSPTRELRAEARRAKKSLGQHFLRDRSVLEKSVGAAELSAETVVLEAGPGLGALTIELGRAAGRVIAVEFDEGLAERLRAQFREHPRVRVLTGN